jgi:predicted phosphodiesterase
MTLKTYPLELSHLRVAVIGDSGFGESITYALAAQMAASEPDLVIHVGDIVYSVFENGTPLRAYQAKYFWPFQKVLLKTPLYAVPGNHEYYADALVGELPFYFEVFPPLEEFVHDGSWIGAGRSVRSWFGLRLMGYQFLLLDSQRFYLPGGAAEETSWLQSNLQAFSGPTIGVYHIATYSSGNHESDGLPIQRSWIPDFIEANTAMILSGHDHNYERLSIDGIEFVTTGGGSRSLYSLGTPVEGSQVFAAVSHFVILDIYPDRIELESINEFGDVIDKTVVDVRR